MNVFPRMVEVIPEGTRGLAKVEHITVSRDDAMVLALRGEWIPEGKYARLIIRGRLAMSDTPMEHRTNWAVVHRAHGHVLIAGLGLGMILQPILRKPEVRSVTVVELHQDVIDLVGPYYQHPKLNIICGDIFTWKPPAGAKYDVIYFDIWADQSTDTLQEMARLHRRYGRYLNRENPYRWMDSWRRDELLARRRKERRQEHRFV